MGQSTSRDGYGEKPTDLTAEEIDEVLAMLEDTGRAREAYLKSFARMIARLGREAAEQQPRHPDNDAL